MTIWSKNGIGATTGPQLATCRPLVHGGKIWFVNSTTGSDSYEGNDRALPFATLQAGVDAAVSGDTIVMLGTHSETISTVISLTVCLEIIGEGVSSGLPTARLKLGGSTSHMFDIGAGAWRTAFRGIRFVEPTASTTGNYIRMYSGSGQRIVDISGCYMPMNGYNAGYGINGLGSAAYLRIEGCTFVSTATASSLRPWPAVILPPSSGARSTIVDCTFNGGTVGFKTSGLSGSLTGTWALYGTGGHWRVTGTSFLNGADVGVYSAVTGYISMTTASSSARVVELYPS